MRIFGFEIQIKRYKRKPKTWKKAIKPKLNLDLDLIHQLKKEGVSNREIARRLGVSEGTIRNRLKELDDEKPFILFSLIPEANNSGFFDW